MAVSTKDKISIIITLLKNPKELNALLSLKHSGYLKDVGWFNAFNSRQAIGKNNEPIPWVSYPFIEFITPRLNKQLTVFEYGAGSSTLFYTKHVKKVTSVEHSKEWIDRLSKLVPSNSEITFAPENDFANSIIKVGGKYDIIIVDDVERVECVRLSPAYLTENGVIILDDSEREEYQPARDFMKENNFKSIDFYGISPGYLTTKCTTVFYKSSNCLGI